ncbi:MAG: hypothetical protein ACO1SV_27680 [Fimbriimonas sp.]
MARVIDTLITELQLRGEQYIRVAGQVTSATKSMAVSIIDAGKIATGAAAAGLGIVAAGAIALGSAAFNAYGDLQELKSGLNATAGSAEAAERQLVRLKDVAKLPGLDLDGAIQMSISLQATEMHARLAERGIVAFGNALATVGRSNELGGVVYGIGQVYGASTILAEDLNIIKERVPQVGAALKRLYGTARSDELAKLGVAPRQLIEDLITELEKLPKVSGGAKNSVVNLGSAIKGAMATAGESIARFVVPVLDRAASLFEWLDSSGVIKAVANQVVDLFDSGAIADGLVRGILYAIEVIKRIPSAVRSAFTTINEGFNAIRTNFVALVKYIREGAIVIGAAFIGVFVGGAVIKGLTTILNAWKAIQVAIKSATLLQLVYEAVVTKGAAVAVNAGIMVSAFAAGAAFLNSLIPQAPEIGEFKVPAIAEIGKEGDDAFIYFKQWMKDQEIDQAIRQKSATDGAIGSPGSAVAAAMDRNTSATERNTRTQERIVDLNRQLQGGGTFGEAATSELAIARATGRTGLGDPDLERAMHHLGRYASRAAGLQVRANSRRAMDAGAF